MTHGVRVLRLGGTNGSCYEAMPPLDEIRRGDVLQFKTAKFNTPIPIPAESTLFTQAIQTTPPLLQRWLDREEA